MREKVTVGLTGISFGSFWGFREAEYKKRIVRVRQVVESFGARLVVVGKTFQNAEGATVVAKELNEKVDLVILDVATYPEGKATGVFFDNLTVPLMLWSRNESKHKTEDVPDVVES